MTFSDPSFFFFTSSMHVEMIKPSEQWHLMKWVKSTVVVDKKIPGQRITDLCVDSMYPLVPQTPLALKTSTQDGLFCTSVGSCDYTFPSSIRRVLQRQTSTQSTFSATSPLCHINNWRLWWYSILSSLFSQPWIWELGPVCRLVQEGNPHPQWQALQHHEVSFTGLMGISDLTGRVCSLLGPLFPGAITRVPGLRQDSGPLLAGGCFPGLCWPDAFGSSLRTVCN